MSRIPDVELVLREYLAGDGDAAPDYVLDVVAERIGRQRQRRTWRLRGRPNVNLYAKLVAAAAAVLVVGFVGWQLLPGQPGQGGNPTPIPTPAPTAAPTVAATPPPVICENDIYGCAGPLQAGNHTTGIFRPAFDFSTPTGWGNWVDLGAIYGLSTSLDRADPILVWSNARPAEKNAACEVLAAPGFGTTAADWVEYLTTHPGLVASNVHPVDLNGSAAQVLDLTPNPTWVSPCASDRGSSSVAIIKSPIGLGDGYGIGDAGRIRFYAIDLATETVLVTIYSYSGGDPAFARVIEEVEPIVETFDWN